MVKLVIAVVLVMVVAVVCSGERVRGQLAFSIMHEKSDVSNGS